MVHRNQDVISNVTRFYSIWNSYFTGPTIVHEWGHLRWGLWDEYPVFGGEKFHLNSNRHVSPVMCGKHMKGKLEDSVTGGNCTINSSTALPTDTCQFKPDKNFPGVTASMMCFHYISEVSVLLFPLCV